jgi:thiazolylpeptide-type bacteriocin precursor
MHQHTDLNRLASEIAELESETFEIADYADDNQMFLAIPACSCFPCSTSACSTVG